MIFSIGILCGGYYLRIYGQTQVFSSPRSKRRQLGREFFVFTFSAAFQITLLATNGIAPIQRTAIVTKMGPKFGAQKFCDIATSSEAVDSAVAAENLKAVATNAIDPEVVLGLACLARSADTVRRELAEMAVRDRPEFRAVAAVIALTLDGPDESTVMQLIERDPDNALGHYVQANLLYERDSEGEATEAFRRGAHCSELRLYESITGPAIFKALDALRLDERDRLCALSWMACRSSNFGSSVAQFLSAPLADWSRHAQGTARQEICNLMVALAGHLFATNFYNRWAAKQALDHAVFGLNANAPDKFSSDPGSGGTVQGLLKTMLRWPGEIKDAPDTNLPHQQLRMAQFLPDTIHRALAATNARHAAHLAQQKAQLSEARKAVFEKAQEEFATTAQTLINAALKDIDGLMRPYLSGISLQRRDDGRCVVPFETGVEKLLRDKPEVFAAAAANQSAMHAMWDAEAGDPTRRNISRMMEINMALHRYAATHENRYPESIDLLFEQGLLKPPLSATSVLTGKPYVYVAAGQKVPWKSKDKWPFVVLYDDNPDRWGSYQCVFASWAGGAVQPEHLKQHLEARSK